MAAYLAKLDAALHDKNCPCTQYIEMIEKKTNVPRKFLVLGVVAFVAIWLMVGYGAQFLSNFIGFLYPAYASIKAIESKEKDDDTKWLTYWVVYSAFALVEFFSDTFLFWIPFYWLLKCLFLAYCFAPTSWNGSLTIYHKVIRPFVLKHEKNIDSFIDRGARAAREGIVEVSKQHDTDGRSMLGELVTNCPRNGRKVAEEAAAEVAKKHFE